MNNLTIILFVLVIAMLSGCSHKEMMDKIIPKEEVQFAKDYLLHYQNRDFEHAKKYLGKRLEAEITDEKLKEIADYFPTGKLLSDELIGSHVNIHNSNWYGRFIFEYQFEGGWAIASISLEKTDEKLAVIGIHVYQTQASQKELNAFTLANKSIMHYLMLVLVILMPLFILVTAFFCIRTPMAKRKWLWILFILIGFASLSLNWSTGQLIVQPLSFRVLSASALAASPYAPWIISVSFPLGAMMFWLRRKEFIADHQAKNQLVEDTKH